LLPEDEKDEVQEQFRWVYGYYENWDNWDKEEKNVFNDIQKDIKKI
jgi:GH18 family chitinase